MYIKHFENKLALGGDATIVLVTDEIFNPQPLFGKLWREIFNFERQFSRFLPDSELSQFNRQAGLKLSISNEFKELLLASKAMSQLTNGVYNPFILPALQQSGYKSSALPGYEHDPVDDHSNRRIVSYEELIIGDNRASIPYGTAIDMGGCGKGYLADKLANIIDEERLTGYWISLGGDMVLSGYDETNKPWQTLIQSAKKSQEALSQPVWHDGSRMAVATSGTLRRQAHNSNKNWHHLIDPRTGQPADTDITLATVVDRYCLRSDVFASCAVVLGGRAGTAFLRKQQVTGAYIQLKNGMAKSFGNVLKLRAKSKIKVAQSA